MDSRHSVEHAMPDRLRSVIRIVRAATEVALAATLLIGCATAPSPTPASGSLAPTSHASPIPSPAATALVMPASPAASEPPDFFAGVVDLRPAGWSFQTNFYGLDGFPTTSGQVYGPVGAAVPPIEGPGRLVLYESFPASDAYLHSRIDQSRRGGGTSVAVEVSGQTVEVWVDDSTGELLIGWTVRGKSEVLVANSADFTVEQLVRSAESVSDCCG
jgi:hypothetical protein